MSVGLLMRDGISQEKKPRGSESIIDRGVGKKREKCRRSGERLRMERLCGDLWSLTADLLLFQPPEDLSGNKPSTFGLTVNIFPDASAAWKLSRVGMWGAKERVSQDHQPVVLEINNLFFGCFFF